MIKTVHLCGSVRESNLDEVIQRVLLEINIRGKKKSSHEIVFRKGKHSVRAVRTGYGGYYTESGSRQVVEILENL